MSRSPLEIPKSLENLPRRAVLRGLIAAPTVLASAATGQALSSPLQLAAIEDERFETFRHLAAEELRLGNIEGEFVPGDPARDAATAATDAADDALFAFKDKVWSEPIRSPADVLLRIRIAEHAELRYNADGDIWETYAAPGRNLAAGLLEYLAANPSFGALAGRVDNGPRFLGVTKEDLAMAVATDGRFAALDDLIQRAVALDVSKGEGFSEYDAETIEDCTEMADEQGAEPWVVLHTRLCQQIEETARSEMRPARDLLDLMFQIKLAHYFFEIGDVGIKTNEICGVAVRDALMFWGMQPLTPVAKLGPPTPPTPERPREPSSYELANNARVEIRRAEKRLRKALEKEGRLEDGTAAHAKAVRATNKRQAELDALSDRLMSKFGTFPMADDYQLRCELLYAHRSDLVSSPIDDRAGRILCDLLKQAREIGDWRIEDAAACRQSATV